MRSKCFQGKEAIYFLIAVTVALSFSSTTPTLSRRLSQYFGNGHCLWSPPIYDVPENITFTKTLVAGYPSGDKRLTFVQMEALTGLSARDEWDFAYLVSILVRNHSSLKLHHRKITRTMVRNVLIIVFSNEINLFL